MLILYDDHVCSSYMISICAQHHRDTEPGRDRDIGPSGAWTWDSDGDPDRDTWDWDGTRTGTRDLRRLVLLRRHCSAPVSRRPRRGDGRTDHARDDSQLLSVFAGAAEAGVRGVLCR